MDLQELANTYRQISLRKTQLLHRFLTHYLPLYFPEAKRYQHSSRAEWWTRLMLLVPCPAALRKYSQEEFIAVARRLDAQKIDETRWLADFYQTACTSIGLPVPEGSEAIRMFRLVLQEYLHLCRLRDELGRQAVEYLSITPISGACGRSPALAPSSPCSFWLKPTTCAACATLASS